MLNTKLKQAFEEENGIMTIEKAKKYGVTSEALRKAALRGDIVKQGRGIYLLSEEYEDDMVLIQHIFKRGIYSHLTAMMLHNLSTFSPFTYHMTFPYGYHSQSFDKWNVTPAFVTDKYYSVGIEEIDTWFGNKVLVYNKERTVIETFKTPEMIFFLDEILDNYWHDPDKDVERLWQYAKLWKLEGLLDKWNRI